MNSISALTAQRTNLPLIPAQRRHGCPTWCTEDHTSQAQSGMATFHSSRATTTPIGGVWLNRDRSTGNRIFIDVRPGDPKLTNLTVAEARKLIAALSAAVDMAGGEL